MDITGKLLIFSNVIAILTWIVWMWRNTPKKHKKRVKQPTKSKFINY